MGILFLYYLFPYSLLSPVSLGLGVEEFSAVKRERPGRYVLSRSWV